MGYNVVCEVCGKIVYQTQTQYNRAKHHFCSNKCQMIFQHNETYEDRICEVCHGIMHVQKKSTQRFCSYKCQSEWQKTRVGILNPQFKREKISCEWCDEEYYEKQYKLNTQHNFCSSKCRQDWYANVYSKSAEWKEQSAIRAVNILENHCVSQTNSTPQTIINHLLDDLSIVYVNEKNYTYYAVDNYLSDFNLIIEIMGDFWHSNPTKYKQIKYDIQKNRIGKDKSKHTYIKNNYNIEILYLWENDIKNNFDVCKLLIMSYINNNGLLSNYHSFNYNIVDGSLMIVNTIIPFFEMDKNYLSQFLVV